METTIYDSYRRPRIYLADDGENSIYTWDGHAVACLDGEHVYGWRGRHIGWFSEGILYDLTGYRIGFTAAACKIETFAEPAKYSKLTRSYCFVKGVPYTRPRFSQGNSNQDLEDFIRQDAP